MLAWGSGAELVWQRETGKRFVSDIEARHSRRLRRYLAARLRNAADVADLAQEVFLRLLRVDRYDAVLWRVCKLLASGFNPSTRKIYSSAGAEEDAEADIAPWRIAGNLPKLAQLFDPANDVPKTFKAEIFPGEYHCTAWATAFMHGVQFVFRS